ncbi:DNA helicase-2/ATP-dependent DNA helicase PcrA [Paenibacillus sp. V4I3]|uniref:ATP-dependent helicase n=1 Tax=Paenibacillus sp. V4I3 TaxID=3042305 RepID=UPI00277F9A9B|nr:ATP-dependent helicase [Paenibacillus sp. V4I3]MDQ0878981.1 DNA helicase-2/ATP-dependent DNA helicase PcrA [Paenibacillus sp. V4I3]
MSRFWENYNSAQKKAITAPLAHMIINAAAGTGKTTTLAARILFLQQEFDIAPGSIIAISFSRTARSRLVEKITKICKENLFGSPVPTYTFHGLAFRIIRIATGLGETWLKPGFDILDSNSKVNRLVLDHQDQLLKGVGKGLDKEDALIAYFKAIDELRQGSTDLPPFLNSNQVEKGYIFEVDIGIKTFIRISSDDLITVWHRYEKLLKLHNKIDYTGLIIEAINVLNHSQGLTLNRVQEGLKVIVVDEYQDTSRAQELLLFTFAGLNIPINVVGDTDQTIYTFNGSSIANMRNFPILAQKTNIPINDSVHMIENFRSTPAILDLANQVRINSKQEHKLVPANEITDEILKSYREKNFPNRLIHAPRLKLAAEFVAHEIERLIKEDGVQEHEIVVLVRKNSEHAPQGDMVREAILNLSINVDDSNSISISSSTSNRLEHLQYFYEFCQDPENYGRQLVDVINDQNVTSLPEDLSIEEFTSYLNEAHNSGAIYCYEAVDQIFSDMNAEEYSTQAPKGIQIRTVHSAKGEEFRIVFLLYLGDRSFPHGSQPDIEEERRLLYVGVTRAQERLYILGKPGVHHEDFFNLCKGTQTETEMYDVFGGKKDIRSAIDIDPDYLLLIENARSQQREKNLEERNLLWKMFKEDNEES